MTNKQKHEYSCHLRLRDALLHISAVATQASVCHLMQSQLGPEYSKASRGYEPSLN
jgi:hypothetical protein